MAKSKDDVNFREYVGLATKTESCNLDLINRRLESQIALRLLHAALGMTTEVVEFFGSLETGDLKNTKE